MNKPEDIPQDAWNLAARFMERSYSFGAKEFAARAIIAAKAEEREACAKLAEGEVLNPFSTPSHDASAREIAAAIRKRGEG